MRLYLDTSVLGAVADTHDLSHVEKTRALLQAIARGRHAAVISNVVQEELAQAPERVRKAIAASVRFIEFELVVEDPTSRNLFTHYMAARIVPTRFRDDLRHVAAATVARVDALVSWNFRHLVNVRTRRAVNAIHVRLGWPLLEIVSPEEV